MSVFSTIPRQAVELLRPGSTPDAPSHAERLLLGERPVPIPTLVLVIAVCCGGYGAAMGTFGGVTPDRFLQIGISALKLPLLLLATLALSWPSYAVAALVLGLGDDLRAVTRALLGAQAALSVVLLALAPFTLAWYAGEAEHSRAILFNAAMLLVAAVCAQVVLRRACRPLIQRRPAHRRLLTAWLIMYAFVGIQMGWVMRPFVGSPGLETQLFRASAWGNAYLEVFALMRKSLGW